MMNRRYTELGSKARDIDGGDNQLMRYKRRWGRSNSLDAALLSREDHFW